MNEGGQVKMLIAFAVGVVSGAWLSVPAPRDFDREAHQLNARATGILGDLKSLNATLDKAITENAAWIERKLAEEEARLTPAERAERARWDALTDAERSAELAALLKQLDEEI